MMKEYVQLPPSFYNYFLELSPIVSSQPKEGEIPQVSIPPMKDEPTSPSTSKKQKK